MSELRTNQTGRLCTPYRGHRKEVGILSFFIILIFMEVVPHRMRLGKHNAMYSLQGENQVGKV